MTASRRPGPPSTATISEKLTSATQKVLQSPELPQILSSATSAMGVILLTHPFDTARRRLQASSESLRGQSLSKTTETYLRVTLGEGYGQGITGAVCNLYPGVRKALVYKGW